MGAERRPGRFRGLSQALRVLRMSARIPPGRAGSGRGAGYRSLAFRPAGVQSGWSPDWPGRRDCCSGGRQDRARQGWPGPRCQGRRRADARLLRGAGTVRRGLLVRPCRDGPSAARTWSTGVNRPPGAPSGVPPVHGSRVTARASQARAGRASLANASARRPPVCSGRGGLQGYGFPAAAAPA